MANALHTPGVVDSKAARLDDGGLLALQGPGALDVRTGVLVGPGSTALVTGTSSTSPMRYSIAAHHWVASRSAASGPYRGTLEATQLVDTTAAPGTGSRIDVIWAKQQDNTVGIPSPDGTAAEQYGCTQGTSTTGIPTKPPIPVGAVELATGTVSAGATSTNGAGVVITQTARQTVARGARIPVRNQAERDALTAFPGLEVYRLDNGQVQLCTATGPTTWDTLYDPARPPRASRAYTVGPYIGAAVSGAVNTLLSLAIPDPGWPYVLLVDAVQQALVSPSSGWYLTARIDSTSGTRLTPVGVATSTTFADVRIQGGLSGVLTGAHSVLFCAERVSGTAGSGYQVNTDPVAQSYRVLQVPA